MAYIKHRVVTPPTVEPVSLEDAKLHLRLIPDDDSEDEGIIKPIISAARAYCENITGRALAAQTVAAYPDAGATSFMMPKPPVIELEAITAYREDGEAIAVDPSSCFLDEAEGRLYLPAIREGLRPVNPIEVIYRAGYEQLPFELRQAMLLLIGHWYENREAVVVGAIATVEPKQAVITILNQHKVWWF